MSGREEISSILRRIDGRSYRAYQDLAGGYDLGTCTLHIDHVQRDPFASPSKVRLRVNMAGAGLDRALFETSVRRVAFADYLARCVSGAIARITQSSRGSGKSGRVEIDVGGQEVLERTAVVLTDEWVEARLTVGLPARGRTIMGREADALLAEELPQIAERGLTREHIDPGAAEAFVHCVDNQEHIRGQLEDRGLVAFIADGSVLPRGGGASDRPLGGKDVVPWCSPESFAVQFEVPNATPSGARVLRGTGIPRGVTVIAGGGYHGKSTLLEALQRGVYPHVPGDGREYVVTDPRAVKIRAENGRRVERVDISPFITNLPHGRSTDAFRSEDASGSTSQAANIMEAVEVGASALLLDEDTSATNFMVRDARMQALVRAEDEPITPFVDRVRALYEELAVSTVLVMGGSGDYFDVADHVILMRAFVPSDATEAAKTIARTHPSQRQVQAKGPLTPPTPRGVVPSSLDPARGRRDVKIDAKGVGLIVFGTTAIELWGVEQLVDPSQTRAVGHALELLKRFLDEGRSLSESLTSLEAFFVREGLDPLDPFHRRGQHPGDFARPRRFEVAAALNRLRTLRVR